MALLRSALGASARSTPAARAKPPRPPRRRSRRRKSDGQQQHRKHRTKARSAKPSGAKRLGTLTAAGALITVGGARGRIRNRRRTGPAKTPRRKGRNRKTPSESRTTQYIHHTTIPKRAFHQMAQYITQTTTKHFQHEAQNTNTAQTHHPPNH